MNWLKKLWYRLFPRRPISALNIPGFDYSVPNQNMRVITNKALNPGEIYVLSEPEFIGKFVTRPDDFGWRTWNPKHVVRVKNDDIQ